jgi:hypothetical protein
MSITNIIASSVFQDLKKIEEKSMHNAYILKLKNAVVNAQMM